MSGIDASAAAAVGDQSGEGVWVGSGWGWCGWGGGGRGRGPPGGGDERVQAGAAEARSLLELLGKDTSGAASDHGG